MTEFIYGYGRTKHILARREVQRLRGYEATVEYALCGATGGYPFHNPTRPICQRCAKKAAGGAS